MKKIFYNSFENRLKAGWRIFVFMLVFMSFSSLIFIIKPILGDITKREYLENYSLLIVAILSVAATASTYTCRKLLDKRSFSSLGLKVNKQAFKDLSIGFILSLFMITTFFCLLLAIGLIEFNGLNIDFFSLNNSSELDRVVSAVTLTSLCLLLLEHIFVGYWEELVFRGYLFQNMVNGMGLSLSVVISCIAYGLVHSANPNSTLLSSIIIAGFGFLRIYGYLGTKMLWLSMGMHIGWNFLQGPIFGFAASGHKKQSLFLHDFTSNKDYLTGGEFGPEGSILILPILFVTLGLMTWYSNKLYRNPKIGP